MRLWPDHISFPAVSLRFRCRLLLLQIPDVAPFISDPYFLKSEHVLLTIKRKNGQVLALASVPLARHFADISYLCSLSTHLFSYHLPSQPPLPLSAPSLNPYRCQPAVVPLSLRLQSLP